MRRTPSWKAAMVAAIGAVSIALLGLNAASARSGGEAPSQFAEGTVIRSSFLVGRGLNSDGTPDEITTDYWLKVGRQGEEESLRATLKDGSGAVVQDGIRRRTDSVSETYFAESAETVRSPRPQRVEAVMWSEDAIADELLRNGFEPIGKTEVAGLPAHVFELTSDIENEPPEKLLKAAGIDQQHVARVVRRVYVGAEPFGVDLGEEAGYALSDGSEFIPYYRRVTAWEIVNSDVPAGLFEWSPSVAGEAVR